MASTVNSLDESLLVHLGGLGDVCLSESAFCTVARHFNEGIRAVGSARVLERFGAYFSRVDSIDRREWTYLFTNTLQGRRWKRIVFFGKDREGAFRARLSHFTDALIFVDLYPDHAKMHVELHQLAQLASYGMEPVVLPRPVLGTDRIILYPEAGFQKRKWPVGRFVEVFERLNALGLNVILMRPPGLELPVSGAVSFEGLDRIEAFFSEGGTFFSNDSGMAHFAARCGLLPLTLFWDADPVIWRPKGSRTFQCLGAGPTVREAVDFILSGMRDETSGKPEEPMESGK